jgi:hypothetical protein
MIPVPTAHGRCLPLDAVAAGDVSIRALAAQLSLLQLWNGATHWPYSPAQRGVLMSECFSGTLEALYALLHPAPAAFTGVIEPALRQRLDMVGRAGHGLAVIEQIEDRCRHAVRLAVGIPVTVPGAVFEIDLAHTERALWATEIRDLCAQSVDDRARAGDFGPLPQPLRQTIKPWGWQNAESRWLRKYRQLAQALGIDPERTERRDPSPFPGLGTLFPSRHAETPADAGSTVE